MSVRRLNVLVRRLPVDSLLFRALGDDAQPTVAHPNPREHVVTSLAGVNMNALLRGAA